MFVAKFAEISRVYGSEARHEGIFVGRENFARFRGITASFVVPVAVQRLLEALSERRMAKWNRRQFLNGLLVAAGANATAATHDAFALATRPEGAVVPGASPAPLREALPVTRALRDVLDATTTLTVEGAPHDLQRMLPQGLRFGRWRVVDVLPVKFGAVPVILETMRGERFQVDVLRRERQGRARRGVAETRHYALYLSNAGRGAKPTREEHGLGVMWLAALMRPQERRYAVPALLTLRERIVRYPTGRFDALGARR